MRLYYDKATNRLVRKPGYSGDLTQMSVKRGDKFRLDLEYYDGSASSSITGTEIVFAVKMAGAAPLLAIAETWAEDTGVYTAWLDTNTQAILDELGAASSISAVCELTYSEDAGATWTTSQTVGITIHDDVYSGVEGTPLNLQNPEDWWVDRFPALAGVPAGAVGGGGDKDFSVVFRSADGIGSLVGPDAVGGRVLPWTPFPSRLDSLSGFNYGSVGAVVFPVSLVEIGTYTFEGAVDLVGDLVLPPRLVTIGVQAFNTAGTGAGNLIIPDSVTDMVNQSLESWFGSGLVLGTGVPVLPDYLAGGGAFNNLVIPEGITHIGLYCFYYGSGLTEVDLPASLVYVDTGAFSNCNLLATVRSYAPAAPAYGTDVFASTAFGCELHVPVGATGYGPTWAGLVPIYDL